MRDLNYYKTKLAEAEARRNRYMRQGRYREMQQLDADIQEMKRLIADCEPKPVNQLFSRRQIDEAGLVPAVLEIHLAADYLAACCYTVEDIVKQLGAEPVTVIPDLKKIIESANNFCAFLYGMDDSLKDLITDDETLLNALHKKSISYMQQRMKHNKTEKK